MNIGDKYARDSRCAEVVKITPTDVTYRFTDTDTNVPDGGVLITVNREEFERLRERTVRNGVAAVPATPEKDRRLLLAEEILSDLATGYWVAALDAADAPVEVRMGQRILNYWREAAK